ncbi:MAG: transglutaminase-like domain-containing protein [Cytophagales bacterium]
MKKSVFDRNFVQLFLYLVFLVLPTGMLLHPFLSKVSDQITFLERNPIWEYSLLAISTGLSFSLYFFRLRFLIGVVGIAFLGFTTYEGILLSQSGEFDVFYATISFAHNAILVGFGWLLGFGLARFRYFPMLISIFVFGLGIVEIAKHKIILGEVLTHQLLPVFLYAFYNHHIRESLDKLQNFDFKSIFRFASRAALFLLLIFALFKLVEYAMRTEIQALEQEFGAAGGDSGNGEGNDPDTENMLQKNKNDDVDLNEYAKLKSRFGRSDELLFAAYLDNYFDVPGLEEIPNPLYFTSYHLSRYNQAKEQFEVDDNAPSQDLFFPKPNSIPLYFQRTDTAVLKNDKNYLFKKPVEVDVYLSLLSPNTFTAPSTSFSCQPISVDPDYQSQFKFAYKAKSLVSTLNSAYFVYNAGKDKELKSFQEMRVKVLKQVKDYKKVDSTFYAYYTHVPKGAVFDSIADLAKEITKKAKTPIEKVLAVRDYFLSNDPYGKPLYKYTLTPGSPNDPNIPNASKLAYFLFKNRKGYCTYFAGASLFLLRSVGVPVRMVSGFMTVDRADKNKGWYWFYGDQAHAWIQVYFPDYGWLDFDTTIGDESSQEAPRPDGTPPMNPPKAYFTGVGTVLEVDNVKKTVTITMEQMMLKNKEYVFKNPPTLTFDASKALIKKEKLSKSILDIKQGTQVAGVSFDVKMRRLTPPGENEKASDFVKRIDNPLKVDELYIQTPEEKKEEKKEDEPIEVKDWKGIVAKYSLMLFALLLMIWLFTPLCIYLYFRIRTNIADSPKDKAHFAYRSILFLLNQYGFHRNAQTPLQYAKNNIDSKFNLGLEAFMNTYLKSKYSNLELDEKDLQIIRSFESVKHGEVSKQIRWHKRILSFIDLTKTQRYFVTPIEDFE